MAGGDSSVPRDPVYDYSARAGRISVFLGEELIRLEKESEINWNEVRNIFHSRENLGKTRHPREIKEKSPSVIIST